MSLLFLACTAPGPSSDVVQGPADTVFDSGLDSGWTDTDVQDTQPPEDTGPIEPDCPDGVICVEQLPFTDHNTTVGGARNLDTYACAPSTDESGPEVVYQLDIREEGFLSLDLRGMGDGADVDIHLVAPDGTCIDRGHWAAGAWVDPGLWTVVADTWVDGSGNEKAGTYTLKAGHLSLGDLEAAGMELDFAEDALQALDRAWEEDHTQHVVHGFIDFSLHSSLERLWVWDTATEQLLHNLHVTHGEGSSASWDAGTAAHFSNVPESHQSSLGVMVTAETYTGSNGWSMRMDGLEPGYNDRVRSRYIVVHGATYARPEYVATYGRAGQSWGCPAVDDRENDAVIADLQNGFLISWYPDDDWSKNSTYLD